MRALRWAPPAFWALAILLLTSIPNPNIPAPKDSDKVLHFGVYAILGVLTARAAGLRRDRFALCAAIVAGVSLFGAIDEWHQYFIPGRSPAVEDWIADSVGGLAGTLVVMFGALRRVEPA